MDCEYAKPIKGRYANQCECTVNKGFCKYIYYCHTDKTVKNTAQYIDCKKRIRAIEKQRHTNREENEQ